jgi:hypothetical protein
MERSVRVIKGKIHQCDKLRKHLAIFLFQSPKASFNPGQGQDKVDNRAGSGLNISRTMERPEVGKYS